jgi:hypothetical protein
MPVLSVLHRILLPQMRSFLLDWSNRAQNNNTMRFSFPIKNPIQQAAQRFRAAVDGLRVGQHHNGPIAATPLPQLRTASEQWACIMGVLFDAQARSTRALASHRSAAAQVDAATYALQRLREEMAPALRYTLQRPSPAPPAPTAFRREHFRRREPIAA